MENKKGNGIFLGVVSVATLIVAIVGATFAYFSAVTQSDPNAVNVTAYEYSLSLSMSQIYPENATSGIIPLLPDQVIDGAESLAPNNTNLLYALNVAENKCIDDQGLQVCALYQVTIENGAVNPVTLSGQIKTTANDPGTGDNKTGFANLTYQSLTGDHEDNSLSKNPDFEEPVTLAETVEETVAIAPITVPGATGSSDSPQPGVGTAYILIYLNDNNDQSAEMGAKFGGQVIYSSAGEGGTNLTGRFTFGG